MTHNELLALRTDVLAELHAVLECFPVSESPAIRHAIQDVGSGRFDPILLRSGAADTTALADLAILHAKMR